jgi:hypothetical protein
MANHGNRATNFAPHVIDISLGMMDQWLPQTGDRVGIKGRITADNGDLLNHGLGD